MTGAPFCRADMRGHGCRARQAARTASCAHEAGGDPRPRRCRKVRTCPPARRPDRSAGARPGHDVLAAGADTGRTRRWAARQRELCSRDTWIIDGDLGPYDQDLRMRLRAADTVIVLDLAFPRVAWRALRRGRERADLWRWAWVGSWSSRRSAS